MSTRQLPPVKANRHSSFVETGANYNHVLAPMTLYARRHFLATLAAAGLGMPQRAGAIADSATLEMIVENSGWGKAAPVDVRAVVLGSADEIWRHCQGQRIKPIHVYHRTDFPQTDFVHDWRGRIRIGLHSEDAHWAQMAFQFGHEFCHALAQHSAVALRGWHPPVHANLWFEESLCETSSLFVLRRLGAAWQQAAPRENWRSYAPALTRYASERLDKLEHQLPAGVSFPNWWRENEPALRLNAVLREKDVIVARQMLPCFEAEPAGWAAAAYLNLGAHQPEKPLAQYLGEWQNNCPPELRPFVGRIAALFLSA
jgi:hypothetical protein